MPDIVKIFTDEGSSGNPGPGGYGVILLYNGHRKELSGGYRKTTNNRMELKAVIEGLKVLKRQCKVTVYCDSKYIVDSIKKGWIYTWQNKNWKRTLNKIVINADLWLQIYELMNKHEVDFEWVRGHNGNTENEKCDEIAIKAYKQPNLPLDTFYESQSDELLNGTLFS